LSTLSTLSTLDKTKDLAPNFDHLASLLLITLPPFSGKNCATRSKIDAPEGPAPPYLVVISA
jgi:hypothetical protein